MLPACTINHIVLETSEMAMRYDGKSRASPHNAGSNLWELDVATLGGASSSNAVASVMLALGQGWRASQLGPNPLLAKKDGCISAISVCG